MSERNEKMTVPMEYVYARLICEFAHWDCCLEGLIDKDGEKWFCRIVNQPEDIDDEIKYNISPIDWTDECEEYLIDYHEAYRHWFYDGKRMEYDGRPLKWFSDKWGRRNPIEEQAWED